MVVYADILMLVNFVVDYFLISLTSRFLRKKVRLWRLLLSAATGGVFSLYIFLPKSNFLLELIIHILISTILCFIALGFEDVKNFLRSVTVLFLVNFAYSGAMIAVWLMFKPNGMVINNSVVYFNISPLFFILFSLIGYFVVVLLRKILKKPFLQTAYCEATLFCGDKKLILSGIVDTGNSLKDVFGISQIFIVDKDTADSFLDNEKQNPTRFRKIPCGTIVGEKLLDGYRIDDAIISFNNKKYNFKNPVLAVSNTPLIDSKLIVNPENLY